MQISKNRIILRRIVLMMTRQQTVQRKVLRKVKKNWVTVAIAGLIASNLVAPATASAQSWTARTPEEISQDIQGYKTVKDLSTYQIVWGDTLWGLSQASGFSISEFISAFGIQNPNLIYAGNRLGESSVGFTPSRTKSAEGTYKVVYGDTLSSIAASFDTTVERLVSWNNIMNQDLIFPGQNLLVTENAQIAESDKTETEEAQNDVKENTPVTGSEDETETVVEEPVISDDESDYDNVDEEEETESDVETPEDEAETGSDVETPGNEEETGSDVETPEDEEETGSDVETPEDEEETGSDVETPEDEEETESDVETPAEETPSEPEEETPVEEVLTKEEQFIKNLKAAFPEVSAHFTFGDAQSRNVPENLDVFLTIDWEGVSENAYDLKEDGQKAADDVKQYIVDAGFEYLDNRSMFGHIIFVDVDSASIENMPVKPSNPVEENPVEEEQPSDPVEENPIEEEQPTEPVEEVLTKEEQFIKNLKAAFPEVSAHFTFGDAQSRNVPENLDVLLSIKWEGVSENAFEMKEDGQKAADNVKQYLNDAGFEYFDNRGMIEHIFFVDVDSASVENMPVKPSNPVEENPVEEEQPTEDVVEDEQLTDDVAEEEQPTEDVVEEEPADDVAEEEPTDESEEEQQAGDLISDEEQYVGEDPEGEAPVEETPVEEVLTKEE